MQTQQQSAKLLVILLLSTIVLALFQSALCKTEETKVSGGTAASDHEFPHMASIQYLSSSTALGVHFCGGTIISNKHILTAAHCNIGVALDKLQVVVGSSNNVCTSSNSASTGCLIRKVVKFTSNPTYSSSSIKNDVAIIELDVPLPLDGTKITAAQIEGGSIPTNNMVYIAGWGRTTTAASVTVIQKALVPISPMTVCNAKNLGATVPQQICAGNGNGIDTCGGDSGGPLFRIDTSSNVKVFVVAGIVSYGPAGCGGTNVGIYTNTTSYLSFISGQVTASGLTITTNAYGQTVTPITPTPSPTPVVPKPSSTNCNCACKCKKLAEMRKNRMLRGGEAMVIPISKKIQEAPTENVAFTKEGKIEELVGENAQDATCVDCNRVTNSTAAYSGTSINTPVGYGMLTLLIGVILLVIQ